MTTLKGSGRFLKKCLENACMYMSRMRYNIEKTQDCATWIIRDFYNFKYDVVYKEHTSEDEWKLSFTKKRGHLVLSIQTHCDIKKLKCFVVYGDEYSNPIHAGTLGERKFLVTIPLKFIENARNKPLKVGNVVIRFVYDEAYRLLKESARACHGVREESDVKNLASDLNRPCITSLFGDFIIHVNGKEVHVPKALLASRSDFFVEYPNQKVVTLNTYYKAVSDAVKYMYACDIPGFDKLEGQEIIRLLEVAKSLRIKSLTLKCLYHINNCINGLFSANGVMTEGECIPS